MLRRTLLLSLAAAVLLPTVPALPETGRVADNPRVRLSGPHVHETLAVYFIHGTSAAVETPQMLEEAMARQAIRISETKRVSELEVENLGDAEVLIHAGDIVKGGWQDRVLSTTLVLPPKSGKLVIGAYCVESGRWKQRGKESASAFNSAGEMLPSREAKLALASKPSAPAERTANVQPNERRLVPPHVLFKNVDPRAQAEPQQQRVTGAAPGADTQRKIWDSVGAVQNNLAASLGGDVKDKESETSLQLTLERQKVADARKAYMAAIEPKGVEGDDIIGFVFAVNGRISGAETYASNGLFKKLWPKLLRAAVTEAIAAEKSLPRLDAPGLAKVETFLDSAPRDTSFARKLVAGVEQEVRESKDAVVNVFSRADGKLVHRSLLAR